MTFLCYIQDLPEECHLLISPDLLPTAPKISNQLDNIGVYPLITLHDDQNNRVIRLVHHHNISTYYRNHDHVVYTSTSTDLYRTDIHTPRDKAFYHTIAQDTAGRPPCQMYMLHLMHGQNETTCMIEVEQGIPLGACDRNGAPLYGAQLAQRICGYNNPKMRSLCVVQPQDGSRPGAPRHIYVDTDDVSAWNMRPMDAAFPWCVQNALLKTHLCITNENLSITDDESERYEVSGNEIRGRKHIHLKRMQKSVLLQLTQLVTCFMLQSIPDIHLQAPQEEDLGQQVAPAPYYRISQDCLPSYALVHTDTMKEGDQKKEVVQCTILHMADLHP